jgi:LmbE family N-acetylglucosaminyl deacetylase
MLESQKTERVLILAAHPDDETLGCGGVIHNLSLQKYKIELITFTDGVGSRNNGESNRNPKLQEVSNILGISKFTSGNFPDNAMDSISLLELSKFIENNTSGHYDMIFTHFVGDLNIDHQLVAKATLAAFRPQYGFKGKIYSYYVPSSTDYNFYNSFNANSYFNINQDNVNAKLAALKIYDKEIRPCPHSRSYENVENLMKVWGAEVGLLYCEKFKLIREII